jgi:hypothetical protein
MTYPPPGGAPDPYQPPQPYGQSYNPYAADPAPVSDPAPYGQQPVAAYQPYQAQSPYGAQPPYGPPMYIAVNPTNTLAILALVFAFLFPIAAIVMGHIAKKQIAQTGEQGEGMATAGLVLGYIFTGIGALVCAGYVALWIGLFASAANS